jgi:hypothetical protein
MAASSSLMIAEAERRFPVRIRIGVPSDGLGSRLDLIKSWLDENCGASGVVDDTFWHTWCAERCPVDLFRRRPLRVPLSSVGVPVPRSRPLVACFGCGRMSRSQWELLWTGLREWL